MYLFVCLVKLKQEPFLIAAHKEIYNETNKAMSSDAQDDQLTNQQQ